MPDQLTTPYSRRALLRATLAASAAASLPSFAQTARPVGRVGVRVSVLAAEA